MKEPQDIILKPLVSEKSYAGLGQKIYHFVVARDANKREIKDAVEKLFNVRVLRVNTMNVHPKAKRRGVFNGFAPGWKKAVVCLNQEDSIPFFEGIA